LLSLALMRAHAVRKGGCPGRRPKTKKAAPPGAASERSLDNRRDDQLLRSSGTRSTVVVVVVPVWLIERCTLIITPTAAPRIGSLLVAQAHMASIPTKPPTVNPRLLGRYRLTREPSSANIGAILTHSGAHSRYKHRGDARHAQPGDPVR
jgi:hypothetical protein